MRKIRISSLPRIMGCHASAEQPEIEIDSSSPASILGTAVHAVLEDMVKRDLDHIDSDKVSQIASKYNIEDTKEMRILSHIGRKAWTDNIKPHINMETLIVEDEVSFNVGDDFLIVGHPDGAGVSRDGKTLIVWDFKSGYIESDATNQLRGYAYACLCKFKEYEDIEKVIIVTAWLRTKTLDVKEFSVNEIREDFYLELLHVLSDTGPFNPTPDNCRYCPRLNCEAKVAMSRGVVGQLVDLSQKKDSPVTRLQYGKAYEKICFVETEAKKARGLVKQYIQDTGKRIPLDSGIFLGISTGKRASIDLVKALPTLAAYLMPNEPLPNMKDLFDAISPCLEVSKTKLLKIVSQQAQLGEKGKAQKEIMAHLEEECAVNYNEFDVLTKFSDEEELKGNQ